MQPIDERTRFRIVARVERVGPEEFVATASALPDNGDRSLVQGLTETLPSLPAARERAKALVARMREIVAMDGGQVTEVETSGL